MVGTGSFILLPSVQLNSKGDSRLVVNSLTNGVFRLACKLPGPRCSTKATAKVCEDPTNLLYGVSTDLEVNVYRSAVDEITLRGDTLAFSLYTMFVIGDMSAQMSRKPVCVELPVEDSSEDASDADTPTAAGVQTEKKRQRCSVLEPRSVKERVEDKMRVLTNFTLMPIK